MQQFKKTTSPNKIILRASPPSQTSLFVPWTVQWRHRNGHKAGKALSVRQNGTATPFPSGPEELEASPRRRPEKAAFTGAFNAIQGKKNEAIRVMFEAEMRLKPN